MIRIQGIVKAAQIARSQLQAGIPPSRLLSFQAFIQETLGKIEEICANANMSPAQLPTPSRKAYEFLAQIDLANLPVTSQNSPAVSVQPIRLKNIRNQQQQVLGAVASIVANPQNSHSQKQQLLKSLQETVATIEGICTQQNATPALLNKTSRQIYAWMKFLTDSFNLERHLSATRRTQKLAEEMLWSQMQHPCKTIAVEFTNITHLYKGKIGPLEAKAQINAAFVNATDEILAALVRLAFLGKNQEDSQAIKKYALSEEYSEVVLELDVMADTEAENPQGKCYNLDRLFHTINREYFGGKMVKPRLSWNRSFTTRKFGHYERGRDRVVLSISLDSDRVPQYVVEFVLYHELLHKQHEGKWVNGRLNVHTPEFRQDEQKFRKYKEADQWLTNLASE
ncbi:M48 family peptidase [Oscillatoria sp. HE19RPO]|uniref:M48 family peptidase n=1 Tax=Oscillatoria sp. HE19RPO TaxID=2954806 RepID=UPI0020C35988|nr:M48 family peptidase [Oscillatoria sp. HE19RPO]